MINGNVLLSALLIVYQHSIVEALDPVTFSQHHGPKAVVSPTRTKAWRYETECLAVCFMEQPLRVGEMLHFQITETDDRWTSNMNVGVIYTDPEDIEPSDLVICDPDISNSLPNTKVFVYKKFYSVDNKYSFHVDAKGQAHLTPNVTYNDIVFTSVDVTKKFWVIFNIFGDAEAIELLGKTSTINTATVDSLQIG